jgi:predicted Rossmann-fold nucleotide-binding protein
MRPDKIISGGQTGADQGALAGASRLGIATGGWMPLGFVTEEGPAPELARRYDLHECNTAGYPARTRANVRTADGTVWVGGTAGSRGFNATLRAAQELRKPLLVGPTAEQLQAWVDKYDIRVLNVAGPRASHDAEAYKRTALLIVEAFGDTESAALRQQWGANGYR